MVQNHGIICFFFMDDIVILFKKNQHNKIENTIGSFWKALIIKRKKN